MTKYAEIADYARKVLARPGAWCKGHDAARADGAPTHVMDAEATMFCGSGAVQRASYELTGTVVADTVLAMQYAFVLANPGPWTSIQAFNDRHDCKLADILAAFERTKAFFLDHPQATRASLEKRLTDGSIGAVAFAQDEPTPPKKKAPSTIHAVKAAWGVNVNNPAAPAFVQIPPQASPGSLLEQWMAGPTPALTKAEELEPAF